VIGRPEKFRLCLRSQSGVVKRGDSKSPKMDTCDRSVALGEYRDHLGRLESCIEEQDSPVRG
jgi:hypothetical protein